MSEVSEMRVVADIVTTGSFSAAARMRSMTPSGVSKLVVRIEDRLGLLLFKRDPRRVALTPEGQAYYDGIRRVLDAIDDLEAQAAATQDVSGHLCVMSSSSICNRLVAPHVAGFLEAYPDLTLEFRINNDAIRGLDAAVDLAFYTAELDASALIARRLATIQHVLCAAPGYLAKFGTPQTPHDLQRHRTLNFAADAPCNAWLLSDPQSRRKQRVAQHPRLTSNNSETLVTLARAGAGIGRFADFQVSDELRDGRLVQILAAYTTRSDQALYAIYHSRRHLSRRAQALLEFLGERLAATTPADAGAPVEGSASALQTCLA